MLSNSSADIPRKASETEKFAVMVVGPPVMFVRE
jgi:hypothetical protein